MKKNWLVVWKRLEKFGKFSPEYMEVSKFVQSRKGTTLNFAEELCVMIMKNNAKFEVKLTCHFKTDTRNLMNFDSSTRKSKKIALWLAPLTKVYNVSAKKSKRSYVWWHWRLMQNLKQKWLVLSKMTWGIWQICIRWNKWIGNLTKLFIHV